MKIAIIGIGYIGTTCAAYASNNHEVICIDPKFQSTEIWHPETEVKAHIDKNKHKIITMKDVSTLEYHSFDFVQVCLPTEFNIEQGELDMSAVFGLLSELEKFKIEVKHLVVRSTLELSKITMLKDLVNRSNVINNLVLVPEFLREGSAYTDMTEPKITVIGCDNVLDDTFLSEISELIPLSSNYHKTSLEAAALCKMAFNAWRALKVAVGNEFFRLSSNLNIDPMQFHRIFVSDTFQNISAMYLKPGYPYGGPCLTKDTSALASFGTKVNINSEIWNATEKSNDHHADFIVDQIKKRLLKLNIKTIIFDSLEFKSGTHDYRNSQFINLAFLLSSAGYKIALSEYDKLKCDEIYKFLPKENITTQNFKGNKEIAIILTQKKNMNDYKEYSILSIDDIL